MLCDKSTNKSLRKLNQSQAFLRYSDFEKHRKFENPNKQTDCCIKRVEIYRLSFVVCETNPSHLFLQHLLILSTL